MIRSGMFVLFRERPQAHRPVVSGITLAFSLLPSVHKQLARTWDSCPVPSRARDRDRQPRRRAGRLLPLGGAGGYSPATLLSLPAAPPLPRPLPPPPAHGQWRGDRPAPALVSAASRGATRSQARSAVSSLYSSQESSGLNLRGPHPAESLEPLTLQSPLFPLNTCHLPSHSVTQGPAVPTPRPSLGERQPPVPLTGLRLRGRIWEVGGTGRAQSEP